MRVGWTPYWLASSLTVCTPLRAAKATCALKLAECCFRLPAIASPFLGHLSSLSGGPVFGVHYSACSSLVVSRSPSARNDKRGTRAHAWHLLLASGAAVVIP